VDVFDAPKVLGLSLCLVSQPAAPLELLLTVLSLLQAPLSFQANGGGAGT
jgi:hypothetical protein